MAKFKEWTCERAEYFKNKMKMQAFSLKKNE